MNEFKLRGIIIDAVHTYFIGKKWLVRKININWRTFGNQIWVHHTRFATARDLEFGEPVERIW